ncbi:MAG: tetratricopeptide repeat protein [Planctomycetes bacterium]|nr:tetratricopeptide repeat protein [Planctomycetota bacterium]
MSDAPHPDAPTPPRAHDADLAILIALMLAVSAAVAWTHWPALSAQAVCFDDSQYVIANPLVRVPSWDSVSRFFGEVLTPTAVKGYYQPLSLTSLMLDVALAGNANDLAVFHRTSLFLHVANCLLVVFFLFQLFGRPVPAALVGLLFGVHPLTVECIPWSGERKTLLATFFALWSLVFYLRHVQSRDARWLIGVGVAYVLSLLSKPTTVPLPLLMLVLDWWPLNRLSRAAVIEKLPLLALGGVSAVITFVSQSRTAGAGLQGEHVFITAALTVCHNIVFYLGKFLWPTNLTPYYPYPEPFDFSSKAILFGLIGTLILIPAVLWSLRRTRSIAAGLLFFFIALLPVMQFVGFTITIASDKFMYLPMIGLLVLACSAVSAIWAKSMPAQVGITGVALALAITGSAKAREYYPAWKDSETLHRHMISFAPNSGMLHDLLAGDLLNQGKLDEAIEIQKKAVELDPAFPVARHNYGTSLMNKGRLDEARVQFEEAIKLAPDYCLPYGNLGNILAMQKNVDKAIELMKKAVELEPALPDVHYNLATLLAQQRKAEEAAKHFAQAIFYKPNYPEAHNNLGILLAQTNNMDKAVENFQQAVRLRPNYISARGNLARALDRQGRRMEALKEYIEITKLDPNDATARRAVNALTTRLPLNATSRPAQPTPSMPEPQQ